MAQLLVVAMLMIGLSYSGSSQTPGGKAAQRDRLEQEVLQVDSQRAEALMHADTKALDQILADDCTYVHPNGRVETKAQILEGLKAGDRKYDSIDRDDVRVRIYGEVAVVTGRNVIKAKYQGEDYTVQNRFTRVYVKRQGRWQLIAHQATNLGQK